MLAKELKKAITNSEAVVFGILKGGVPIAKEISSLLKLPFGVIACQKIPVPYRPELSFGAVSESGFVAFNQPLIRHLGLSEQYVRYLSQKEKEKVAVFIKKYFPKRNLPFLGKKTAVLTDDGLASGYTMLAAIREVKNLKPEKVIVAVPCASLLASQLVEKEVDKFISLEVSSKPLFTIADYFENWEEVSDEELKSILEKQNI